ncbi:MAG: DUF4129 domain-containing protein [Planctomycetota bacterium]|nr:DUF4129 domain-containing protein [Planctomycetota bacterium]
MKPRPTLADYVIIAISPALIMALIGSLVFFLIELFYQGQYQARLQYVFALFVFAAVLIGRISIEEGRERALVFSVVVAVAVLLVMAKFIKFDGIFQRLSWVINTGLVVLILWCANKLTWDCTVIDEQQDASGEGLLQTVGMDDDPSHEDGGTPEPEGTTGNEIRDQPQRTWWQRLVAAKDKKHAPGVWVVYFSMAALPIFGIGQGFMFGQTEDSRRFVFKLLVVYVAAALGLLLTTSFLGLRRYLRQRRLEMPVQMAGAWLGTGAIMIVALLLFCMILPRRNAEYSITDLPAFAGSPDDLQANRRGFGNDGPEEDDAKRQVTRDDAKQESGKPGDDQGTGQEKSKDGKGKSEADKSGQQQGAGKQKSDNGQGDKKSSDKGGEKKGSEKKGGEDDGSEQKQSDSENKSQEDQQGEQSENEPSEKNSDKVSEQQEDRSGKKRSDAGKRDQEQSDQNNESQENKDQSEKSNSQKSQSDTKQKQQKSSKFDPAKLAKQLGGGIGMLLKLLYWLIVIVIVGYFLWRYWAQVRDAVRNFIQAVREFWARLFGGSVAPAAEATTDSEATAPPPRPFSAFPDPFRSGLANQLPLDQLIKYSFEAFEAWARERGFARRHDQTPHEFAQHVAQSGAGVSQEAMRLAELYNRAAYSRDTMPQASGKYLQQLWQQLTAATLSSRR